MQQSCIRHPEHFFVVFPYGTLDWTNSQDVLAHRRREKIDVTTHLGKLQQVMTDYYEDSNHQSVVLRQLEVVAARYDQDGRWYRARVLNNDNTPTADTLVEVQFVDFGNIAKVCLSQVRKLKQEFLHLPFQMVECSLAGVMPPPNGFWSEASSQHMSALTQGKDLVAEVKHVDASDRVSLDLYLPEPHWDNANLADILVGQGLARKCTNPQPRLSAITICPG